MRKVSETRERKKKIRGKSNTERQRSEDERK